MRRGGGARAAFFVAPEAGPATVRGVEDEENTTEPAGAGAFPDTRWTLLDRVRAGGTERERALEDLCRGYWFPLYTWLRRSGHAHADAEDVVQVVLSRLAGGDAFAGLEREGGRLRSWLLRILKNQVVSDWRRDQADRRRGVHVELDGAAARYQGLADAGATPDAAFDRQWALGVLDTALAQLRRHHAESGRDGWFTVLQPALLQTGIHVNSPRSPRGSAFPKGRPA